MGASIILLQVLWTMRLGCWPFEVQGQGSDQWSGRVPQADALRLPSPTIRISGPVVGAAPPVVPPAPPPPARVRPSALPTSLPLFHQARYDIRYGLLGSVGTLTFSVGGVAERPDGSQLVKVEGAGAGAVLGLGAIARKIEADFDPITLQSRRWSIVRLRNGQPDQQGIRDTGARDVGGTLLLERTRPGEPPARETLNANVPEIPTSDPLGLLWRLRTAPPAPGKTEVLRLLDGLALWQVQITAATAREILPDGNRTAIRLEGQLAPIFYDGRPDPDRPSRRFTLWLSDSSDHLPLRLEVPVGLADVVMTLAEQRELPRSLPGSLPAVGVSPLFSGQLGHTSSRRP